MTPLICCQALSARLPRREAQTARAKVLTDVCFPADGWSQLGRVGGGFGRWRVALRIRKKTHRACLEQRGAVK